MDTTKFHGKMVVSQARNPLFHSHYGQLLLTRSNSDAFFLVLFGIRKSKL